MKTHAKRVEILQKYKMNEERPLKCQFNWIFKKYFCSSTFDSVEPKAKKSTAHLILFETNVYIFIINSNTAQTPRNFQ